MSRLTDIDQFCKVRKLIVCHIVEVIKLNLFKRIIYQEFFHSAVIGIPKPQKFSMTGFHSRVGYSTVRWIASWSEHWYILENEWSFPAETFQLQEVLTSSIISASIGKSIHCLQNFFFQKILSPLHQFHFICLVSFNSTQEN